MPNVFTPSETWILLCIHHCGTKEGAMLETIISYGDYTNHSILTYQELRGALESLLSIGLVSIKDNRFFTSSSYQTWWTKKFKGKKTIMFSKELTTVQAYLNETFGEHPMPAPDMSALLSEAEFDSEVDDYLRKNNLL